MMKTGGEFPSRIYQCKLVSSECPRMVRMGKDKGGLLIDGRWDERPQRKSKKRESRNGKDGEIGTEANEGNEERRGIFEP
jgi:hypothetical protein